MNRQKQKEHKKQRRAYRTRSRIHGTAQRPRLSVHRSLKYMYAQMIDDDAGVTLVSVDDKKLSGKKSDRAQEIGKQLAEAAKAKGIETVIFDRGAYRFHGRIKALAEGARAAGLKF